MNVLLSQPLFVENVIEADLRILDFSLAFTLEIKWARNCYDWKLRGHPI